MGELTVLGLVLLVALAVAGWGVGEMILVKAGIVIEARPGPEARWAFVSKIVLGVWVILGAAILLSAALHTLSYLGWYFTKN